MTALTDAMRQGVLMPPVVVGNDRGNQGKTHGWPYDGRHRLNAAKRLGLRVVPAIDLTGLTDTAFGEAQLVHGGDGFPENAGARPLALMVTLPDEDFDLMPGLIRDEWPLVQARLESLGLAGEFRYLGAGATAVVLLGPEGNAYKVARSEFATEMLATEFEYLTSMQGSEVGGALPRMDAADGLVSPARARTLQSRLEALVGRSLD